MKTSSTKRDPDSPIHVGLYSLPGAGKTLFGSSFPNPVLVDMEQGKKTLEYSNIEIPVLTPENEKELRAIIWRPDLITEKVIHKMPGFESYEPKTFIFDTMSSGQELITGEGAHKKIEPMEGVVLEREESTGILSESRNREDPHTLSLQDYGVFEKRMRGYLNKIREMPYHTIVTFHTKMDLTETSNKAPGAKEHEKTYKGYPVIVGSLKYSVGGLCGDFFFYLESNGTTYSAYSKPNGVWHARTRLAHVLP